LFFSVLFLFSVAEVVFSVVVLVDADRLYTEVLPYFVVREVVGNSWPFL